METGHPTRHRRLGLRNLRPLIVAGLAAFGSPEARATGDFYEEPLQTLSEYLKLDQLPAKSFEQILTETSPPETSPPNGELPEVNFAAELQALADKTGPAALAPLDELIGLARSSAGVAVLNLLNDIRDVFAGPASADEAAAYLKWRLGQADRFGVNFEPKKPDAPYEGRPTLDASLVADIERQLAKASPALKPHWLYLRGAVEYRVGNIGESQPWFERVTKEFPKSPRTEVALYMNARCQMWRTRSPEYTQQDLRIVESERPKAKKLFDEYFAKFPKGRHRGDPLGWYAAYAFDGHDFATALRYYVEQLALVDHPELHPMAAQMIERVLSRLASEPKDKAFAEVAKHPPAALALVYLIINTSESDNYNGEYDSIDAVRGWRRNVLPKLAAALSAQAKLYQDAPWKPRHLAILAYALSGAGQHEQALKLLQTAGVATADNDDLLFARAVVHHRTKQPAEAVTTLRTLLEKFPNSPLAPGAQLRLALALSDNHQAGEAVLALRPLLLKPRENAAPPEPAADQQPVDSQAVSADAEEEADNEFYRESGGIYALLFPIDLDQVRALIDTLLNFAPVEELAATARTEGLEPVVRLQFTEAIAQRLLAKEQFDEARKFMTPAQFSLVAEPIAALTREARAATDPKARAAACLKLGDAWAAARGKLLTFPLDTDETRRKVYLSAAPNANLRRADAAPFIGAAGNIKLDLENRDELRHAFNWWLEASDAAPGTDLTAQALWRALRAMPQIADVSPFTYERALTRKWGETSKKLYDRLRTECANSAEAKRLAVSWDFPPLKKATPEAETYRAYRSEADILMPAEEIFGAAEDYFDGRKLGEELLQAAKDLLDDVSKANPGVLKARVDQLTVKAKANFTGLYDARWVNFFEDLQLFLAQPDIAPEVRERYLALRIQFLSQSAIGGGGYDEKGPDAEIQKELETALADAKTKPAADFFEFLDLAVIANHFTFVTINKEKKAAEEKDEETYRTRDYPLLAKKADAFLKKYPQSPKREGARLLHARAVFKASEEVPLRKFVTWPQAPRWEGGNETLLTAQEPFEAKRVQAALDAYDKEFPNGRYAADIRSYRAGVAQRQRDWKTALALSAAQLEDTEREDLRGAAARRLVELFNQLTDERTRPEVLAEIKANPKARDLLAKYLAFESTAHPLRYMGGWLRTQLASK